MEAQEQTPRSESKVLLRCNVGLFVWLVFLVIGGGLLALYYAHVGYLPDIDWHSLLIYLAVASIIGASIGTLQFLLLFLPGYIWAEIFVTDRRLAKKLCYREGETDVPCIRGIALRLGTPFAIVFVLLHCLLPMGWLLYLSATALLLVGSWLYVSWEFGKMLGPAWEPKDRVEAESAVKETQRKETPGEQAGVKEGGQHLSTKKRSSLLSKYSFWFAISVLLSQTALLLIYELASRPRRREYYILTAICSAGVLISNHIVAARFSQHRIQAVGASLILALLLLFAADRFVSLSEKMMALYGFGGKQKVTIVLEEDEATALAGLSVSTSSCEEECLNCICGVRILSSVGSEYVLSAANGSTFTVPKSMVVSWIREKK